MADMTRISMSVRGAEVVTVPIDDTLTIEGQAADAKATGDALALKADKSELQAAVKVNNQPADAQGLILIDGRHIPVSDEDAETLAEAVTDLKGQTAENIPMSSDSGAKTIAEVVNANAEAIESMEEMTGATMPIESGSQTTVKAAIEARVKTVNQKAPDPDGNVDLSVVPLAENLQSDKMQSVDGTFIIRTTGGSSSVSDGKAYPQHIMGTSERTGYVAEELNMTVIPIERTEPDEPITATIDRDVFVAYVDESSTINLYYTTEWSEDPELYGVTVEGTPVAGDQIKIVYVKEERGTIQVSNPERLVGTGWNLFNFNAGYARVVRYSDEYGYKIGGAFTSIEYSATPEGDRVSILPGQNGLFQVPGDGYVFVNGGNATDTYILATWSDWTEGPATGYWEAYKESGIDLSAVMGTYFPYGMLSVGTIHDEIDLSAKRTISRVERMAYTEENLAAAIASGREYIYDTNYIYLVRAESVISAITIDTVYNVSEHGMEWFTGTTMPLITEILYGKNLRDKLERDVLTISQQTLAEEEKAQVRRNIGVMDPPTNGNGTLGQLLQTNGDGTTKWTTQGTPTDAQVGTAVSAWLTAHPEATTTVQDGAISRAKLNDDLKAKTDAVPDLKSALGFVDTFTEDQIKGYENGNIMIDSFIDHDWRNGSYNVSNGAITIASDTKRVCATGFRALFSNKPLHIEASNGYYFQVRYTDKNDWTYTNQEGTGWKTNETYYLNGEKKYVLITIRYGDGTGAISVSDIWKNVKVYYTEARTYKDQFIYRGVLSSSDDCDNAILPGVYRITGSSLPDHKPFADNVQTLLVYYGNTQGSGATNLITQFGIQKNVVKIRSIYNSVWSDWEIIAKSDEVAKGIERLGYSLALKIKCQNEGKTADNSLFDTEWENSSYNASSGSITRTSSDTRVCASGFRPLYANKKLHIEALNGYYFQVRYTDKNDWTYTEQSATGWKTQDDYLLDGDKKYVLITVRNGDGTGNISVQNAYDNLKVYYYVNNDIVQDYIPEYYQTYMSNKAAEVNAIIDDSGLNGDSFVFVTDYHVQSNTRRSNNLVKYIMNHTGTRFIFFGGDVQNWEKTFAAAMEKTIDFKTDYKDVWNKMFLTIGNHEFNSHWWREDPETYPESIMLTQSQIYGTLLKGKENEYKEISELGDYYFDNPVQKIRYFVIGCNYNANLANETRAWLFDQFHNIPEGYLFVVLSHVTFGFRQAQSDMYVTAEVGSVARAMQAVNERGTFNYTPSGTTIYHDYSDANGRGIAIIGGHVHFDVNSSEDIVYGYTNSIPIVARTCDAYKLQNVNQYGVSHNVLTRTPFTTSEQAFDVVHIDKTSEKIKFVRIGAGDTSMDLEVEFAPQDINQ